MNWYVPVQASTCSSASTTTARAFAHPSVSVTCTHHDVFFKPRARMSKHPVSCTKRNMDSHAQHMNRREQASSLAPKKLGYDPVSDITRAHTCVYVYTHRETDTNMQICTHIICASACMCTYSRTHEHAESHGPEKHMHAYMCCHACSAQTVEKKMYTHMPQKTRICTYV